MILRKYQKIFILISALISFFSFVKDSLALSSSNFPDSIIIYNFNPISNSYSYLNGKFLFLQNKDNDTKFRLLDIGSAIAFFGDSYSFGAHFGAYESYYGSENFNYVIRNFNNNIDIYSGINFAVNNRIFYFSSDISKVVKLIKSHQILGEILRSFLPIKSYNSFFNRVFFSTSLGLNFLYSENYFLGPVFGLKSFIKIPDTDKILPGENIVQSGLLGSINLVGKGYNKIHLNGYVISERINKISGEFSPDSIFNAFFDSMNLAKMLGKIGFDLVVSGNFYSISLGAGFVRGINSNSNISNYYIYSFKFNIIL